MRSIAIEVALALWPAERKDEQWRRRQFILRLQYRCREVQEDDNWHSA